MFQSCKNAGGKNAENTMAMILLKTQEKSVLCPHLRFCVWFQLLHQKDTGERQRGFEREDEDEVFMEKIHHTKSLKRLGLFKER